MTTKKSWFKKIKEYIPFALVILSVFLYFNSKNKVTSLVKKVYIENRVVKNMVRTEGFEPSTNGLRVHCSTTELRPQTHDIIHYILSSHFIPNQTAAFYYYVLTAV